MNNRVGTILLYIAGIYAVCHRERSTRDRLHVMQERLYQVGVMRAARLDIARAFCPHGCSSSNQLDDILSHQFMLMPSSLSGAEMTQRRESEEPQEEPGWLVVEMVVVTTAVKDSPHAQQELMEVEGESTLEDAASIMDWDDMVHAFIQGLVQEHQDDALGNRRLMEESDDSSSWPPDCLLRAWKEQRVQRDCSLALNALDEADRVRHDLVHDYRTAQRGAHHRSFQHLLLLVAMVWRLALYALECCCDSNSAAESGEDGICTCCCCGISTSEAAELKALGGQVCCDCCQGTGLCSAACAACCGNAGNCCGKDEGCCANGCCDGDAPGTTYQPPVVIVKGTAITTATTTTNNTNNSTQTDCKCCCCGLDSTQLDSMTVVQACCDCCRGTGMCAPKCASCCGDAGNCCGDDGCCGNGCCSDDNDNEKSDVYAPIRIQIV